jgi:hypothetical protein
MRVVNDSILEIETTEVVCRSMDGSFVPGRALRVHLEGARRCRGKEVKACPAV